MKHSFQDTIKVEPKQFNKSAAKAITEQINLKYANKVRGFVFTVGVAGCGFMYMCSRYLGG